MIVFISVSVPDPLFPDDYSTVVYDSNNRIMRVYLNSEQQYMFPPEELELPEKLIRCICFFEDQRFFSHPGIDPLAVLRAVRQNLFSGKRLSGASTITMQTARMICNNKRTYFNKLMESIMAVKMEIRFSKKEILTAYVNHAPYGGNIRGISAASYRYFGRTPQKLTWAQAAMLAVLPNNPGFFTPGKKRDKLLLKRNLLLKRLSDAGFLTVSELKNASCEPLPEDSGSFPLNAPHLCDRIHKKSPGKKVVTTLDLNLQQKTEMVLRENAFFLKGLGIRNSACLIARTADGAVVSYAGSQDYFDPETCGMVDGVTAARSSGSILKPFLYALSIDSGLILPDMLIPDIPSHFGSFSPVNSDHSYRGLVSCRNALTQSLNVPAVRILNQFGTTRFYNFLKDAGMSTLFRTADQYGLSLILGGAETSLWDLAGLYRGLSDGRFGSLHFLDSDSSLCSQMISEQAAFLTTDMLTGVVRPESETGWQYFSSGFPVAWKTGTSFGHRDAWACAVTPDFVVAVWSGNFNGEGNPLLSGASCSGTILFNLISMLPNTYRSFKKPEGFQKVKLCSVTGYPAGSLCPCCYSDSVRGASGIMTCPYHQSIFLSSDETETVCSLCWKKGEPVKKTRLIYPPEIVQFLRESGTCCESVPKHRSSCPAVSSGKFLSITYPLSGSHISVPAGLDGKLQKITARAALTASEGTLYWYLNNCFLGCTVIRHSMSLYLLPGKNSLQVSDSEGHVARVSFQVSLSNRSGE